MVFKDGKSYVGPFKNDIPNGEGKLNTNQGEYFGYFDNGISLDGVFKKTLNGEVTHE